MYLRDPTSPRFRDWGPGGIGALSRAPIFARKTPAAIPMEVWRHGATEVAQREAKRLMTEVLGSLGPSNLSLLEGIDIQLHIIPHDKKLTDLHEFSSLKGEKTFDGRNYDDLRGAGGVKFGRSILYAAGEETLDPTAGIPSKYHPGYVVSHESGHVVEGFTLPKTQRHRLDEAFAKRTAKKGPWISAYASSNAEEYFATATAAFFGYPKTSKQGDRKVYTRGWLKVNDRAMYGLLRDVYRKAPD